MDLLQLSTSLWKHQDVMIEVCTANSLKSVLSMKALHNAMTQSYAYHTGWVVVPSDSRDPEANTLKMWERKLREFTKKRLVKQHAYYKRASCATPTSDDHYHH